MRKNLLAATIFFAVTGPVLAEPEQEKGFYEQRERGWFWHEPEPPEQEEPEKVAPQAPTPPEQSPEAPLEPSESPVVVLAPADGKPTMEPMSVKWFNKNLPKARVLAIDSGQRGDMRRYLYMQRAAVDKASEFTTNYIAEAMFDPYLNEGLRRPTNGMELRTFRAEQYDNAKTVFDDLGTKNQLIYFYSSSCPYCAQQTPHLIRAVLEHGWEVLPVSLDGGPVPNDPEKILGDYKVATPEMAQTFAVTITPTLYLATEDKQFLFLSPGLTSLTDLYSRTVLLAKTEGLISDELYNTASQVRSAQMISGVQMVDTDRIYEDPEYLVEMMRARLTGEAATPPQTEMEKH